MKVTITIEVTDWRDHPPSERRRAETLQRLARAAANEAGYAAEDIGIVVSANQKLEA